MEKPQRISGHLNSPTEWLTLEYLAWPAVWWVGKNSTYALPPMRMVAYTCLGVCTSCVISTFLLHFFPSLSLLHPLHFAFVSIASLKELLPKSPMTPILQSWWSVFTVLLPLDLSGRSYNLSVLREVPRTLRPVAQFFFFNSLNSFSFYLTAVPSLISLPASLPLSVGGP